MESRSRSRSVSHSQSVTTSLEFNEDQINELEDERLQQLVNDVNRENDILVTETIMFEKYMKGIDPKDLSTHLTPGSSQASSQNDLRLVGRTKRTRSKGSYAGHVYRLTAEQKCDIAQREIEDLNKAKAKLEVTAERVIDFNKAKLEECIMRIIAIDRLHREFYKQVERGAVNPRTNKLAGEKLLRFLEEVIKTKDGFIEKLKLKNTALKIQNRKLDQQLRQKEEMGEVLNKVDFDQLQIENQQYLEKIEDKNQDLLKLKLMSARTQQILVSYKKKLDYLTQEADRQRGETASRLDLQGKIDHEAETVQQERDRAEKINNRLRQQLADYRVPDVMDYVHEKQELIELKDKVKTWERKVEIAEMALRTSRKTWRKFIEINEAIQTNELRSLQQGAGPVANTARLLDNV